MNNRRIQKDQPKHMGQSQSQSQKEKVARKKLQERVPKIKDKEKHICDTHTCTY